MDEKHYHIEIFNGDLIKVVFEDGYAPYDHTSGSRTLTQAMAELKAFRDSQRPHDLRMLPLRYSTVQYSNEPETEVQEQQEVKPPKRSKRKAE